MGTRREGREKQKGKQDGGEEQSVVCGREQRRGGMEYACEMGEVRGFDHFGITSAPSLSISSVSFNSPHLLNPLLFTPPSSLVAPQCTRLDAVSLRQRFLAQSGR